MNPRTTSSGRSADGPSRRRPPASVRRPGLYLGVAAAGALTVNLLFGSDPAAQAEAGTSESVSVAEELGLTAQSGVADAGGDPGLADLQPLEDLTASRSTREAEQTAAQQAQAAADRAELDRRKAEEEAAARAAAEAAAASEAAASSSAAASSAAAVAAEASAAEGSAGSGGGSTGEAVASGSVAATAVAKITNTAGALKPRAQAAADAVVSNVPGAGSITLGGTRPSATDPGGHPSGLAVDYMVLSDAALGDAIVAYHRAHWDELGVEYIIWQQRMLSSPNGSWEAMADRGGTTANHYDHVHVNYR